MSEVLFIGQNVAATGQLTGDQFRDLHVGLMSIPEDVTEDALESRLDISADLVLATISQGRVKPQDLLFSIYQHVTSAIGQQQFEIHTGQRELFTPMFGWAAIAKSSLETAAEEEGMLETKIATLPFFSDNRRTLAQMSRRAYSSLQPAGAYERYAVAAGIGSGQLQPLETPISG